jgi:hypothetical protein
MTIESVQYWDVFPKLIRVSQSGFTQYIPLSIRGEIASPVFESSNQDIAAVDEAGNVMCGFQPGAAMIMVWDSPERTSLRHVQVEVYGSLANPSEPPEEPEVPY